MGVGATIGVLVGVSIAMAAALGAARRFVTVGASVTRGRASPALSPPPAREGCLGCVLTTGVDRVCARAWTTRRRSVPWDGGASTRGWYAAAPTALVQLPGPVFWPRLATLLGRVRFLGSIPAAVPTRCCRRCVAQKSSWGAKLAVLLALAAIATLLVALVCDRDNALAEVRGPRVSMGRRGVSWVGGASWAGRVSWAGAGDVPTIPRSCGPIIIACLPSVLRALPDVHRVWLPV